MYHVAQKMKIQKELVCSFFEHLFEGTENIKRGEWFKIVTGNGEQITPTPLTTVLIITKYSHLIILN
jgi:hypothetical protein